MVVMGAGAWGTALATLLARGGGVVLWGRDPEQMRRMRETRRNERHLPGVPLPPSLEATGDLDQALAASGDILVVVPSRAFVAVIEAIAARRPAGLRLAWATKGFEPGRGRLLYEPARERLGADCPLALLSGPTFAGEVAAGLPTAVTVASSSARFAADIARRLHSESFRVYTSDDLVGVATGGAVKNVLALAAGIADGLGYGANARAALITRGLAELVRLGAALGGRRETFMGLAGLGDLLLTATDDQSRNRRAGLIIGRGGTLADAESAFGPVIEGAASAAEAVRAAGRLGVEVPIVEQVHRVLGGEVTPTGAVRALLSRAPGTES